MLVAWIAAINLAGLKALLRQRTIGEGHGDRGDARVAGPIRSWARQPIVFHAAFHAASFVALLL
ncbi:MAG: hypothetical protein HYX53_08360 [Chloroflexi bacterium]|nr:hypothetical protein [Chloroflexota bacterium]